MVLANDGKWNHEISQKKAARHTAGRLRVFRILYLSLLQRLYEHPPLLLPLDGEAVLEHVQGEPVGAVARDDGMDDAWREVGQTDDPCDVAHVPADSLRDVLRAADLVVVGMVGKTRQST